MSTLSEFIYIVFYIVSRLIFAYFAHQKFKEFALHRKNLGDHQLIYASDFVPVVIAIIPIFGEAVWGSLLIGFMLVDTKNAFMKFVNNIYSKY